MPAYTTYSFQDVVMTISHPKIGQYIATGSGIGSITISMATDRTTHDVAADGSVMASKVQGRNGTAALAIQQTSHLNKWLLGAYNYLDTAAPSQWAQITITIRSSSMGDSLGLYGTSFQKLPDKPYQSQGQQVTWNLMAQDIHQS